jgi:hypothetical protein
MGHGKCGGKGMMFANPSFEQMARHWLTFSVLTPVLSRWLILVLVSDGRQEAWRTFG